MKEYFKFLGIFFTIVFLFFSISIVLVNAGVLDFKVLVNNDGIHGSKIIVSWFQGDDTINLGPDQCGLDGIPGNNVPYAYKNSDSSSYPNVDSDPTGCDYCGGDSACNEGLANGVENYFCDTTGACQECVGVCSSNTDCGTGYTCDTSLGLCNADCVCDPVSCSGSVCIASDQLRQYTGCSGNSCGFTDFSCTVGCIENSDGTSTYYSGCSNGACDSGTTFECSGCQDKVQNTYEICVRNADCTYSTVSRTETVCPGQETQSCTDPNTCACIDFGVNCDGGGSGLG